MQPDGGLASEVYVRMLRIRRFDESAIALSRKGEIPGALHCSTNQEAAVVGAALALREDDFMTGNHRSHGHPIGKGARTDRLMAEMMGKATGICKGKGGSMHLADFSALTFFGDGAANAGAIHESMNLSAIWSLPGVFFCENNQWAVATPVSYSTSVPGVATRATAYDMVGVTVDDQDAVAVYEATLQACHTRPRGRRPDAPGGDHIPRRRARRGAARERRVPRGTTLELWPGMPHVWHSFAFMLGEGARASAAAAAFIHRHTEGGR